jgi:hypothetical protein
MDIEEKDTKVFGTINKKDKSLNYNHETRLLKRVLVLWFSLIVISVELKI